MLLSLHPKKSETLKIFLLELSEHIDDFFLFPSENSLIDKYDSTRNDRGRIELKQRNNKSPCCEWFAKTFAAFESSEKYPEHLFGKKEGTFPVGVILRILGILFLPVFVESLIKRELIANASRLDPRWETPSCFRARVPQRSYVPGVPSTAFIFYYALRYVLILFRATCRARNSRRGIFIGVDQWEGTRGDERPREKNIPAFRLVVFLFLERENGNTKARRKVLALWTKLSTTFVIFVTTETQQRGSPVSTIRK